MNQHTVRKHRRSPLDTTIPFYLFIAPWLIGFLAFTLIPMLYSIYGSFTSWNAINSPVFTGISNYLKIFTGDSKFGKSMQVTFYYACTTVPLNIVFALTLAVLLNQKIPGTNFFRSVFYLPCAISGIAVFMTWTYLFKSNGIINIVLDQFGIAGPNWLSDRTWAMPALIIMNISTCGSAMLIFLAGLQDIPQSLYEAAMIDGANVWKCFVHVTLPLLTPTVFFNLITGIIGGLQMFSQAHTMTGGGPVRSTYTMGLYIYEKAFQHYDMGYACALAVVLFLITLILGLFVLGTSRMWVYNAGEEN